jgi:hypothetical protein
MIEDIKKLLDIKNRNLTIFLSILFALVASLFIFKAYINANAIGGSIDFPQFYYLSKDFWAGKDIFNHFPGKKGMAMWNHIFYIIFYPFTLFTFEISKTLWFFSNVIFAGLIVILLKKAYNLNLNKSLILGLLTVSSTPFTNTLGNGQLGLFILMSITIYWYSKFKIKKFFLAIAYIKFSFAPFFLINSLFKKEIDFIYAVIISTLAVIFYGFYVNELSLIQFINPILTILSIDQNVFIGDGHNFHIRSLFSTFGIFKYYPIAIIFFSILNLIIIFSIKKKSDLLFILISISNLLIFYHNYYDLVFLIPLAGYLLKKNISAFVFIINFPIILFFFYFVRFNQLILNSYFTETFINTAGSLLLVLSYISLAYENVKNK